MAGRLAGARPKYVVGNHGLEPEGAALAPRGCSTRRARCSRRLLEVIPGLELEDKRFSLSVHYKRARRRSAARTAVWTALESLETPVRVVPGIEVFNVLPLEGPTKGDALLSLVASEGAERALYAGDDTTDEDVFRIPPLRAAGDGAGGRGGGLGGDVLREEQRGDRRAVAAPGRGPRTPGLMSRKIRTTNPKDLCVNPFLMP